MTKDSGRMHYPYINFILSALETGNVSIGKNFGHHIHWGYWEDYIDARCDDDDFYLAAENLTRQLCTFAKITENQTVLDVGCGFGGTISSLNDNFTAMKLSGINIDNRQITHAREKVTASRGNEIEFITGDACDLPFTKNKFDRILAVECIHHFSSREQFFKEACRVLKPGGSITLSDFVSSPLLLPYCKILGLPFFDRFNFFGHCNITTLSNYSRLASKYGLKMKLHDITINTIPTYHYLKSLIKKSNMGTIFSIRARHAIANMEFFSTYRLLTYQIISFNKPEK